MDKPIPEAVTKLLRAANVYLYQIDFGDEGKVDYVRAEDIPRLLTAAQQPDHIVDATKMVAQQQGQAVADDMGEFASDTAALAFLRIIGNGNPNVERAVERLRQSLIAQPMQQGGGEVRIPSAAEWCDENSAEATMEWRAGWDACRVEYPRTAPPSAPVGVDDLSPIYNKKPTGEEARAAIGTALDDAAKAVRVLSTMLKTVDLQGYQVADEILGSIGYAQKLNAALTAAQQQGQAVALDRTAIRLLVAAGFVTEDKANEALRIAHGFDKGPLAPKPMQQGGGEVRQPDGYAYRYSDGIRFNNGRKVNGSRPTESIPYYLGAPPSAPVGVEESAEDAAAIDKAWDRFNAALAQQPAAVGEVVRAAVLAEREACAKACDDRAAYYHSGDDDGPKTRRGIACEACASVIRWRSTVSPKFLAKHEAGIDERLATQHQEPTT